MRDRVSAIVRDIDRGDVLIAMGLILTTVGLWALVRAAALIAPGLVLLWIALPPRASFLVRHTTILDPKRKVS